MGPNATEVASTKDGQPIAIEVRDAGEADYPAIARLQAQAPEAAQWPLGDYSGSSLLIAFVDGVAAGFCSWRQIVDDEAELLNLAVSPAFRRLGVARALLETLSSTARGSIFLEVAETNLGAFALYKSTGWEQVAVRKGYYSNGTVSGIVMKKSSW
jgi:ribosomal-protein-alanine N-acetyltransferase